MQNLFLKPAPGALVRDPVSMKPLDPDGEWKERSVFWTRRILGGDVIESEPPVAAGAPAALATCATCSDTFVCSSIGFCQASHEVAATPLPAVTLA